MWTTCPLCRGSGHLHAGLTDATGVPVEVDGQAVTDEDECPACLGDGGVELTLADEDEEDLTDVDVKDED